MHAVEVDACMYVNIVINEFIQHAAHLQHLNV